MRSILDLSFIPYGTQVSRERSAHPMFELLLYSDINCTDAADIISRLNAHENMNNQVKVELIEVIQEATPDCPWDAND